LTSRTAKENSPDLKKFKVLDLTVAEVTRYINKVTSSDPTRDSCPLPVLLSRIPRLPSCQHTTRLPRQIAMGRAQCVSKLFPHNQPCSSLGCRPCDGGYTGPTGDALTSATPVKRRHPEEDIFSSDGDGETSPSTSKLKFKLRWLLLSLAFY